MPFYKDRIFQWIFAILALLKAGALAYLYFCHPLGEAVLIFPDSLTYVYPAQTWLQYGAFWEAVSSTPMLLRTPGYPVFLAGIQWALGNATWAVVAVQNLLSLFMLVPVYLTTKELAGKTAARWAAGFCAASVLYFSLSFAVLTETLCTFLLAWFIYFLVRFLKKFQTGSLLWASALLAAAIYVRPAAYYFAFAAVILLVCFRAGKLFTYPVWKILAFFALPLGLIVGGWHVRNALQTGFKGFTSVGAYNLYIWNEDYLAKKFNVSVPQAHDALERALPPGFSSLPPARQVQFYKAMAFPLIKESFFYKLSRAPLWAVKTLFGANFVHISRLVTGGRTDEALLEGEMLNHTSAMHEKWLQKGLDKALFAGSAGEVFITVWLGICGFFCLWKRRKKETFFLAVYCLYFWGIGSTFFGAYARFRAPFEFVLCITAAIAVVRLKAWRRNQKGKRKKQTL